MISLIETKKNIRTLNKACNELNQAREQYKEEVAKINQLRNIYAEPVINRDLERVKTEYSEKMRKLATQGLEAVNALWDNQELKSQKLDLSDKKLTTTLSLIQNIGKNLEMNEICDIIDDFKGNIPALRLLGKTLKSSGNEHAARYCNELCAVPDEFNFEEIARSLGGVVYGSDPLESWNYPVYYLPEINRMGKTLGIDENSNPYLEELRAICAASGGDKRAREGLAEGLRIAETEPESVETDRQLEYMVKSTKASIDEITAAHKYCEEHMTSEYILANAKNNTDSDIA